MKEYLTPSEHEFKNWLERNPDYLQLNIEELAKLYGKTQRRVWQLLKVLQDKGHVKREQTAPPEHKIILL